MTKGPRRVILDQYLDTASEGMLAAAGDDWKRKATDLNTLARALGRAGEQAELRIGEQTLTGPALRAGMEEASTSLLVKSDQLRSAGEALVQVGKQLSDTRDARDSLADLGTKPPVYQAPANTTGVEPTEEEIAAQAAASQARQTERDNWQDAFDQQEAKSRQLTQQLDAAFLEAIPPMKEIHGQQDPTEPPPDVPSGPTGPYLPGTQAPPVTGGGGNDNTGTGTGTYMPNNNNGNNDSNTTTTTTTVITHPTTTIHEVTTTPTVHPTSVPTQLPTTTVLGTEQTGVTYNPSGPHVSSPTTGGSAGPSAAALGAAGAAGGAGGLAAGAVRGASPVPLSAGRTGANPVRAIGSTGRAGSAGALSRPAPASSGATARGAGAPGSTAGRSGSGSAAGRGAAAGSTSGRGATGGRGSSGARGAGAGVGGAGGRGGRKGERDTAAERDSLVYDQDWLGDDDVAPGVLD